MTCTKCNVENDDANKFCIDCGEKLTAESFWRHLFNWRYYVFLLLVVVFSKGLTDDINTIYERILGVTILAVIYQAYKYKSNFIKRLLMFFASLFVLSLWLLIIIKIYFGEEVLWKMIEADIKTGKINVTRMVSEKNKNLPIMLNNEIKYEAITSNDNKSITQHLKYINFTKETILSKYKGNVSYFEQEALNNELENSCTNKNKIQILSTGLVINQVYYDKNNQIIGQIYMDEKRCEPYYKTIKE
jgi:hypothetical protein